MTVFLHIETSSEIVKKQTSKHTRDRIKTVNIIVNTYTICEIVSRTALSTWYKNDCILSRASKWNKKGKTLFLRFWFFPTNAERKKNIQKILFIAHSETFLSLLIFLLFSLYVSLSLSSIISLSLSLSFFIFVSLKKSSYY